MPTSQLLSGLRASLSFLTILIAINYITLLQQSATEAIITQEYLPRDQSGEWVISLDGLLMIEQGLVCVMAWVLLKCVGLCGGWGGGQEEEGASGSSREIVVYTGDQLTTAPGIKSTGFAEPDSSGKRANSTKYQAFDDITSPSSPLHKPPTPNPSPIPLQPSILLGVFHFLSIKTFAVIQAHLMVDVVTGFKYFNHYLVILFALSLVDGTSFLSKLALVKWLFPNGSKERITFFQKVLGLVVGTTICGLVIRTDLEELYFMNANLSMKFGADWTSTFLFVVNLVLDYGVYVTLFWVKTTYPKQSPLQVIVSLLTYSTLLFALCGLFTGDLLSTLSYLSSYPSSLPFFLYLSAISLLKHIILMYTLMNLPFMLFVLTIVSKQVFHNVFFNVVTNDKMYLKVMYGILVVGVLVFAVDFGFKVWRRVGVKHRRVETVEEKEMRGEEV